MTAEPVQVLVTIHPPEWMTSPDWVRVVHDATRAGLHRVTATHIDFDCHLVHGQPHGEAKAHREAAEATLEGVEQHYHPRDESAIPALLSSIAHALLALGERP